MKKLPVDNLGFTEIGGVGDMIYRAVRFPEYVAADRDGKCVIMPVFTASIAPEAGTDDSLTGQELLTSLCNLYLSLNNEDSTEPISDAVLNWCRHNIHPYNIEVLCEIIECDRYAVINLHELIEQDGTFAVDDFVCDLSNLGRAFEMYYALRRLKYNHEPHQAMHLYHEGRICDGLPFLERYRTSSESEEDFSKKVLADYDVIMENLLYTLPDFRMRLKIDRKSHRVMFGADIQSIFDIAWYTFARLTADVAPPMDDDPDYMFAQGSILTCMCCGEYFLRRSSRQLYCDNPNCQAERNRKNRRASYARKKAKALSNTDSPS